MSTASDRVAARYLQAVKWDRHALINESGGTLVVTLRSSAKYADLRDVLKEGDYLKRMMKSLEPYGGRASADPQCVGDRGGEVFSVQVALMFKGGKRDVLSDALAFVGFPVRK